MKYPDNFTKNSHLNIWLSTENDISFDYSDGTEAENYIETSLKQASDLSSCSIELANLIHDWASEYHFSPKRANLFRLLNLNHCSSVLELGCGCGAITRYLGENLPQVIGVEGSLKRAEIAALRCRDLDNVEIICEQFQNLEFSEKFDLITLIGVLEYSGKYIDNEEPYQTVLEIVKSNLSDQGILILAIENKLGLKYFAGCGEDHSGVPFDGIEGYSSGSKINTFGQQELIKLLDDSGLKYHHFLYPFPDYKIPDVILKFDPNNHHQFNSYHKWLFPGQFRDYVSHKIELFQEFLALKQLENNELLADLSNSFLVIASHNSQNIENILDSDTLIWKYNVTRLPEFMTSVRLCTNPKESQKLYVERNPLYPKLVSNGQLESKEIICHVKESKDFIEGDLLIEPIIFALRHKNNLDELQKYLKRWYKFLLYQSAILNCNKNTLPGNFWDCTPWNLIILKNNSLIYIDQEWELKETLPINYVVFRGLLHLYSSFHIWIKANLNLPIEKGVLAFLDYGYELIGIKITEDEVNQYLQKEWHLQQVVSGRISQGFEKYIESTKLNDNKPIYQILNQTQTQLQDTQTQLQDTQTQLQDSRVQLQDSRVQLHQTQTQLQETQSRLQSEIYHYQIELQKAQITIAAMETSKFWKLRTIWFKFKHLLNLQIITKYLSHLKVIFNLIFSYGIGHTINLLKQEDSIPLSDDLNYQKWLTLYYPKKTDLIQMTENIKVFGYKPTISIIMPVYNTSDQFLREAIDSVLNQVYPYWELCIADDASTKPYIRNILEEYANKDQRIKVVFRTENGHISRSSNSAIELATGEYIALFDHDDLLTPNALYEVVELLNQHPEADMIYSDEDKINDSGKLQDPFFKPDWCPDSFLSRMYISHLGVYRRNIINEIGGFRVGYEGSQDYDLVLRFTEKTDKIFHIPKVLYHWRIHSESTAQDISTKNYAVINARKAIEEALYRRNEPGKVISVDGVHHIVRYEIKNFDLVSIIIPTKNLGKVLNTCLNSIFTKTTYPNYEVLVIDNRSDEEETKQIIESWKEKEPQRFRCEGLDIPFNFSKINNYAVQQTKGKYLLFLNNDTEVINDDWLTAMVEQTQRSSIGAVGALLLYPDNTIQHAGVVAVGGLAGHSHKNYPSDSPGYFYQIKTVNNYLAVTAACLMCRREVFEEVGGFEEDLAVAFNDVDLCFKMIDKGYRNVYLPHVKLYHYESKSRGYEDTPEKQARFRKEVKYMQSKWKEIIDHDPCYSPNLTKQNGDYSIIEC